MQPEVVRLALSDGDFVDVQKELNAGDYLDLINDLVERKRFARIVKYVIAWSFVGVDGQPVPYNVELPEATRRDTVRSLDTRTLRELVAKLDAHELAQDADREEKKSAPDMSIASGST